MRTSPFPRTVPVLLLTGALFGMAVAWTGCAGGGGEGGGVVYDEGPAWIDDGAWADGGGRGWYGRDRGSAAYVHPNGGQRPAAEHARDDHAAAHSAPAEVHASAARPSDDHHR